MRFTGLKGLLVAAGLAAFATPAHAVVTSWDWQGCGTGKFITCASVHIEIVGSQIVLRVDNYGAWNPNTNTNVGAASVFSELGISGFGGSLSSPLASFNCTGGTAGTDAGCSWAQSSPISELSNLAGAPFAGAEATSPAPTNGLSAGA